MVNSLYSKTKTWWSSISIHNVNKLPGRKCSSVGDSKGTLDTAISSQSLLSLLLYKHRHDCLITQFSTVYTQISHTQSFLHTLNDQKLTYNIHLHAETVTDKLYELIKLQCASNYGVVCEQ